MIRLVVVVVTLAVVTIPLIPIQWIAVKFDLPLQRRIPTFYHRIVCWVIGVRVHVVGKRLREPPVMIVSNHVSWLDITVITAVAPVVFVAKSEVASWPLFGLFAKLQRSVFVDRNRRHKTSEVTAEIAQRLAGGDPVLLFGEGTAGDGNRVLPFRTALIGAAGAALGSADARVWIQPMSIAYVSQQGIPLGRHLRPRAAWYGKMRLVPHIGALVRTGAVDVAVSFGEPIPYDAASDRKQLARRLETAIRGLTVAALRAQPAPSTQAVFSGIIEEYNL